MTSNVSRYLLLDGAQIENLPGRLCRLDDNPIAEWLYHQTPYRAVFEVGPLLVALRPHSELEATFTDHWQHSAGLLIESTAPLQRLAEHLRSLVHARVSGDACMLFRYYDPRIMRYWLPALSPAEKDHVLGPVSRVRLPAGEGQDEHWIVREQDRQSAQPFSTRPWLYLDEQQLQRLNQGKLTLFDQQLLAHVRRYFPDCLSPYSDTEQQEWAALCREGAARYGYSAPNQVARWSALVAEHGTVFPHACDHQAHRQILQQPTLNPTQRLDALLLELHRRWLLTDKEPFA
ncbi:DUF4123 domain-containing protein [Pseudomonas sp. RP23018S]|uniref:DUF4123 domain-containing protein n=1 Tax=Pseudomonas sp. RP23018S TaxID=3096037 RepID=UPI002ACA781C|nr:DUF4123 domain-containing protein [Pseudomonas sp. RP23018S]MDZ5603148.1 DUF4123 domain-containing protein [Pseudomonas sp. RP23018S]